MAEGLHYRIRLQGNLAYDRLQADTVSLLQKALAPSTLRAYKKALNHFRLFAFSHGLQGSLPISVQVLCCFITYLHKLQTPVASISQTLSAISYFHKVRGLLDPTHFFTVKQMILALNKSNPKKADKRLPITEVLLFSLVDQLNGAPGSVESLMLKTMFLLAFSLALRVGEITKSQHNIQFDQIEMWPDKIAVTFLSYKHGSGLEEVHVVPVSARKYCVVKAMHEWVRMRGSEPGPLFKLKGKPVTKQWFSAALKASLYKAKTNSERYSSHSFRIGAATHWVNIGLSDNQIMRMGRWHSNALLGYLRGTIVHQ